MRRTPLGLGAHRRGAGHRCKEGHAKFVEVSQGTRERTQGATYKRVLVGGAMESPPPSEGPHRIQPEQGSSQGGPSYSGVKYYKAGRNPTEVPH